MHIADLAAHLGLEIIEVKLALQHYELPYAGHGFVNRDDAHALIATLAADAMERVEFFGLSPARDG